MYKKSRKLGEGGFGTVYLGTCGDDHVAIKIYKLENLNGIRPEILREIAILNWVKHPNLIHIVDIKLTETIEIIMDYGGQCLLDFINNTDLTGRIIRFDQIKQDIL